MSDVLAQLRDACAAVAQRARYVRVNTEAIAGYAAALPLESSPGGGPPAAADGPHQTGTREELAAFWLTLDAINFGSGWFPTLRKRDGHSGYHTIAAGISDRFASRGPWSAAELESISVGEIAAAVGQDPTHELMELFARSLADVGRHVGDEHGGSFASAVDAATGSAVRFVGQLASWSSFDDVSMYDELTLPFLKRAQIAAADLARAGVARFGDLGRLTVFADNLVPHVLRLDGILIFDPDLVERIDRGELIPHGSPQEVEIRACAVHAVELIVADRAAARIASRAAARVADHTAARAADRTAARVANRAAACAADLDQLLWLRGQQPRYKALPRHRSRTTAY